MKAAGIFLSSSAAAVALGEHRGGVGILSDKGADTNARILARHGIVPADAITASDSVRPDVLPAIADGGAAALIQDRAAGAHEAADAPEGNPRYDTLRGLADPAERIEQPNATSSLMAAATPTNDIGVS